MAVDADTKKVWSKISGITIIVKIKIKIKKKEKDVFLNSHIKCYATYSKNPFVS